MAGATAAGELTTLSSAPVLVVLPAALVTVTVNRAPLSALVAAGVV